MTLENIRDREDKVIALYHRGDLDTKAIAEAVGISPRSIRRILIRRGVSELQTPRPTPPEVIERIRVYAAEGMPANWIADDLPIRYETALRYAQRVEGHDEAVHEWQTVWHEIRRSSVLLELHRELSPLWSDMIIRTLDAA